MKYKRLGKYVSLSQGLVVNKSTESLFSNTMDGEHPYPLLRIVDFENGNHATYSRYVSKNVPQKNIIEENAILFTRVTCECFRGFRGVFHNNLFRVELISDELTEDYLYTVLQSDYVKKQALKFAQSSVVPDLSHDMFKSILIPVPDIETQKDIAKIYLSIQSKISNNNTICSNLESMAKFLYDYWFVQFDFPDENGKPYKSSGGKMVWNEELKREIPAGWEAKPLDSIIVEFSKSSVQVSEAKEKGLYPFFTSGETILAYDDFFVDGFNCFLNTGGNPDIKAYKGKCAYSTDTWCINAGKYSYVMYLYFLSILSQFEQRFFTGSGLKHLQKDIFKKQFVLLPSNNTIVIFNKMMDKFYSKITETKIENQHLSSLRDFLLPMLMNGQVKVGA